MHYRSRSWYIWNATRTRSSRNIWRSRTETCCHGRPRISGQLPGQTFQGACLYVGYIKPFSLYCVDVNVGVGNTSCVGFGGSFLYLSSNIAINGDPCLGPRHRSFLFNFFLWFVKICVLQILFNEFYICCNAQYNTSLSLCYFNLDNLFSNLHLYLLQWRGLKRD